MDQGQHLGLVLLQAGFDLLEAEGFAPGLLDRVHLGPVATGHIGEAQAEVALDRHQHAVARFDHVGDRGFHGRTAGAAHRNRQAVIGLPDVAEQLLHLPHQLDVEGIQVANRHAGEGLQHGGMGIGGTGTQ